MLLSSRAPSGLAAAFTLLALPVFAQPNVVTGRIAAPDPKAAQDVVISLEAPGLSVTPPQVPVEIDQVGNKFIPHVMPVVKGTVVRFLNSDRYSHNVFSPEGHYTLGTWGHGKNRDYTFSTPGVFTQLCKLHDLMSAFVVVLNTPYFARSDAAGKFEIENVPTGKYTLVAWSESMPTVKRPIAISGGKVLADVTLTK